MRKKPLPLMIKINLMFGVIILFVCTALSIFSFKLNQQTNLSEMTSRNTVMLRTMAQSIDSQMAQVEIITQEMAYDSELIRLFRGESTSAQILSIAFSVGEKIKQNEVYLSGLSADMLALSKSDDMIESYVTAINESRLADNEFYTAFCASNLLSTWGNPETPTIPVYTGEQVIPYYHKVVTGMNTRIGTVRCAVSTKQLFKPLIEYSGNESLMVIRDGQVLFARGNANLPLNPDPQKWREEDTLYVSEPLGCLGALLVMGTDSALIRQQSIQDTMLSCLAIILLGGLLLLVTHGLLRAILSRLHSLTHAAGEIPLGIYPVSLPEEGNDEVGSLVRAFNSLLERISVYYDEIIQKEKDKRNAQSMALQYQLNPHFLFNSLYWLQLQMEEQNVDDKLTASIEQLGQVLRYNLMGSREALLSEEEEHILAYVGFVSAKKGDHFDLSIDIPEELRSARILRFTLQPLLENAIQHGYVPGRLMKISIFFRSFSDKNLFEITVHNNGRMIPADILAALQERIDAAAALDGIPLADKKTGHGTALANLARRLALTYGEKADFIIESDEADTCMRIQLPLDECMRGGITNENPDRR